jgi:hypothetical protein
VALGSLDLYVFATVSLTLDSGSSVSADILQCLTSSPLIRIDLLLESYHIEFLRIEINRYHGAQRVINLALIWDQNSPTRKVLPLTVRAYSTSDSEDDILYHRLAADDGQFHEIPSDRYAIIPSKLPSAEDLLDWTQVDEFTSEINPVQPFITALAQFMMTYCQAKPELPLVSLNIRGCIVHFNA